MELNYDLLFCAYIAPLLSIPWFNLVSYNWNVPLSKQSFLSRLTKYFLYQRISFLFLIIKNQCCKLLPSYCLWHESSYLPEIPYNGLFKTLSNTYDRVFFAKIVNDAHALPIFVCKKCHHIYLRGSQIRVCFILHVFVMTMWKVWNNSERLLSPVITSRKIYLDCLVKTLSFRNLIS